MKRQGDKFNVRKTAKEFNVTEMQIYRIKWGENWGHIVVQLIIPQYLEFTCLKLQLYNEIK